VKCYDEALKLDESYTEARKNEGDPLLKMKKRSAAEECFKKVDQLRAKTVPKKLFPLN
jgi:flagellar biosynthesis protein FlhB